MAVVVSDTTPLHYLILVRQETILERLYENIIIPPGVLAELSHESAPVQILNWARNLPSWVTVIAPKSIPARFAVLDFGERQALALAKEIGADLILLDDKVARKVASHESMKVKGTLGVIAEAAKAHLLNFNETIEELQKTSMHLDQEVINEIMQEFKRVTEKEKPGF
jgi:predicted nucleic acid-binding protein